MIETFTRLQCVERQREIEAMPKAERKQHAAELVAIQQRLIAIRAERKQAPSPVPPAAAGPEVIVLRRSRAPSRPPEVVPQPREPRPFADLRAGIAAETRRR